MAGTCQEYSFSFCQLPPVNRHFRLSVENVFNNNNRIRDANTKFSNFVIAVNKMCISKFRYGDHPCCLLFERELHLRGLIPSDLIVDRGDFSFNSIQFSLFVFISHMIHEVINNGKNDFYTISMRDVDAIKERVACD